MELDPTQVDIAHLTTSFDGKVSEETKKKMLTDDHRRTNSDARSLSCKRLIRASGSRNDYPVILRGLKLSKCGSFVALSPGLCLHRGHLFEIIWFSANQIDARGLGKSRAWTTFIEGGVSVIPLHLC